MSRELSALVCALVFCASLVAQDAHQEPEPQVTIRKRVDLVLVDILLTDAKGNTLRGLQAKDFEILDEKIPQEIHHFSQDEIPLAIALVVDVSGSMEPGMERLRQGLIHALPTLKPEDKVALFSFNEQAMQRLALTREFGQIARTIGGFYARGETNINDAVYEAAEYLRQAAPLARRIIILVTDAFPTFQGDKPVQEALLGSEAALFAIRVPFWLGDKYFSREELEQLVSAGYRTNLSAMHLVDQLAAESGGLVVDVKKPERIEPAVERMIQILKKRYTLGYYPNPGGTPGSIRGIEVQIRNQQIDEILPGAFPVYRNRYRVPPLETPKPPR